MGDKEQYRPHIIQELNSYGIVEGQNGEPLQTMDYFDLRGLLSLEQVRRDTGPLQSVWF